MSYKSWTSQQGPAQSVASVWQTIQRYNYYWKAQPPTTRKLCECPATLKVGRPEVTDEARQPPHGRPQRHDEDDWQCPGRPGQQEEAGKTGYWKKKTDNSQPWQEAGDRRQDRAPRRRQEEPWQEAGGRRRGRAPRRRQEEPFQLPLNNRYQQGNF